MEFALYFIYSVKLTNQKVIMKKLILKSIASAVVMLAASSSHASLVQISPENFGGTGLGSVNTILTIQNTPSETGTVSVGMTSGGADVITGDAKTGASQTQTRSISDLGLTSAADLRVVFNATEPAGNSISLDNLVLSIYSSTGAVLFNSGAFTPVLFSDTFTGTGNSGFVFALDATQAAAAQSAGFGSTTNRIGLLATATLSAGGNETFFVANKGTPVGLPPAAIPEPTTLALLGLGLLGFAVSRRKSSKS